MKRVTNHQVSFLNLRRADLTCGHHIILNSVLFRPGEQSLVGAMCYCYTCMTDAQIAAVHDSMNHVQYVTDWSIDDE